ncbi:MAG: hypothetical protein COY57_03165, partial [Flavobacteriales bacterium CG_4_10_14_0_8_um_filter_32_5]
MKNILIGFFVLISANSFAQTNIISTNPLAEQILVGNYNPSNYAATTIINHPDSIIKGIENEVNADSLKAYIIQLTTFKNRNTGADTNSLITGIGAARKWVLNHFQQISATNDNRLITSYLQFDQSI